MASRKKSSAWRDYQERAAELFRKMGFDATVEENIEGARGKHKVDIVARTAIGGMAVTWIVECKYWKTAIPKSHVLTLAQIGQDIGADRAVLLSESGFQAGAITVSRKSNVLLASLEELESTAADGIADLSIRHSLHRAKELEADLRAMYFDYGRQVPPPPVLDQTVTLLGACLEVTTAAVAAQTAQFPVHLPSVLSGLQRATDELPLIADALASEADKIAAQHLALKATMINVMKPYFDGVSELIRLVQELITAGDKLLEPMSTSTAEEHKLQAIVGAMKAVGNCAVTLRSAPSLALIEPVRALMRELSDGAYLWFADPARTPKDWAAVTARTNSAISRLSEVTNKVRA